MKKIANVILVLIAVVYITAFYSTLKVGSRYCSVEDFTLNACSDEDLSRITCSISEFETLLKSASFTQKSDLIRYKKYFLFGDSFDKEEYTLLNGIAWVFLTYLVYRLFIRVRNSIAGKIIRDMKEQNV